MKFVYALILFIGFNTAANAQLGISSVVAIEGMQTKVVRFYPNPATTVINFEFQKPVDRESTLSIYNFTGKKVFEVANFSQKNTVSLSEFFRGVYIFQLRDRTGKIIESGKFHVNK